MNQPVAFQQTLAGNTQIAVGATATIYTDTFEFGDVDYFALSYKVSCTGVPSVKIEMEQSIVRPSKGNENAADSNFGTPKTIGNIETALTSKAIQHMQLTPVTITFVRFKITELTGIVTDTVVNMWLSLQKKFQM
jgi:hypothetical protein